MRKGSSCLLWQVVTFRAKRSPSGYAIMQRNSTLEAEMLTPNPAFDRSAKQLRS
jgi:hypothetical protein